MINEFKWHSNTYILQIIIYLPLSVAVKLLMSVLIICSCVVYMIFIRLKLQNKINIVYLRFYIIL